MDTSDRTRIGRARGFLEAATLSEAWVREMGRRALILEAYHTTHIAGTLLTLEQAIRRSLQRDLKAIVDMGLLVSVGLTNKLVYLLKEMG